MDYCGFLCPHCNFQLRLTDQHVAAVMVEAFRAGATGLEITCPECGSLERYTRADLKLFRPGGRAISFHAGASA